MSASTKTPGRQAKLSKTQDVGWRAAILRSALTNPERQDNSAGAGGIDKLPDAAQMLTQKFDAYLEARQETRGQFAKRAGVAASTLVRLFSTRSDRKRTFFSRRTLQSICRATEGHISWQEVANMARPYASTDELTPLTRKFEAYLKSKQLTRALLAEQLNVSPSWMSHVFPTDPNVTHRRGLRVEMALRLCKITEGYLTLTDFREAGLCPVIEEIVSHFGETQGSGTSGDGRIRARF
jgi:hypothetical protein